MVLYNLFCAPANNRIVHLVIFSVVWSSVTFEILQTLKQGRSEDKLLLGWVKIWKVAARITFWSLQIQQTNAMETNTNTTAQKSTQLFYFIVSSFTILSMSSFPISGSTSTTSGERSLDAADERPGVDREGAGGRHHRLPHLRDRAQDRHHPSQGRNCLHFKRRI